MVKNWNRVAILAQRSSLSAASSQSLLRPVIQKKSACKSRSDLLSAVDGRNTPLAQLGSSMEEEGLPLAVKWSHRLYPTGCVALTVKWSKAK